MGEPSERDDIEKERQTPRPLHNFTLPTPLKWGHQKQLRCAKLSSTGDRRRRGGGGAGGSNQSDGGPPRPPSRSPMAGRPLEPKKEKDVGASASGGRGCGNEIEEVRQKLTTDLLAEADHMKKSFLDEDEKKTSEEELHASRPWNLCRRRGGGSSGEGWNAGFSPLRRPEDAVRGEGSSSSGVQRPKFSLTLTKEEIEADFIAMTGAKPPRRPKRRPKAVQKQMDLQGLFPGSWLREVTPDTYKVPDNGDQGKG